MNPYCSCGKPVEGMTGKCASCNYEERKELRGLSKPVKLNARIRPRTAKRAAQEAQYRNEVKVWLLGQKCAVVGCNRAATQCHHAKGREGDLLLDKEFWTPTCDEHHRYYTEHSAEAIRDGYSIPRNQ